mgnify:CR=1 FL=1
MGFSEPLWDDEFPGSLHPVERLYVEDAIRGGHSPRFASENFLRKIGYMPQPGAVVCGLVIDRKDCPTPIFSVNEICKAPNYQPIRTPRDKFLEPPKRRGFSRKWGGKWITKTELRRQTWLNKADLKQLGLTDRWIERLERWLAETQNPVRLHDNPVNCKWAPTRLYEQNSVEVFMVSHQFEIECWQRRYCS